MHIPREKIELEGKAPGFFSNLSIFEMENVFTTFWRLVALELIFNRRLHGLMPKLIKKSVTVSNLLIDIKFVLIY